MERVCPTFKKATNLSLPEALLASNVTENNSFFCFGVEEKVLGNLMDVGSNSDSTLSWLPDPGVNYLVLKTSSHLSDDNHVKNKEASGWEKRYVLLCINQLQRLPV